MKAIFAALFLAAALSAAEPNFDHFKVEPLPFPKIEVAQALMSFDAIVAIADDFDPIIGRYPPRFAKPEDRLGAYERWSQAITALEALSVIENNSERMLVLKARLFRQGHNMDVTECGERAEHAIKTGLKKYPDSIPLNFQASYFYLQINPKFAPEGEKALLHLRRLLGTNRNPEIERGFVFAYLYQNKIKQAKRQVDHCLKITPQDEMLLKMREALKSGKVKLLTN